MPVAVPVVFAAAVGFLSCLAISECNGLIMETFDTSDLQLGITGRPRDSSDSPVGPNYSSYPRVTARFACCHTLGFILAAGVTVPGGWTLRILGQRIATAVEGAASGLTRKVTNCSWSRRSRRSQPSTEDGDAWIEMQTFAHLSDEPASNREGVCGLGVCSGAELPRDRQGRNRVESKGGMM